MRGKDILICWTWTYIEPSGGKGSVQFGNITIEAEGVLPKIIETGIFSLFFPKNYKFLVEKYDEKKLSLKI